MIADFLFLTEEEIKALYKKAKANNQKIILWGMGATVEPIVRMFSDLNINFDYWGTGKTQTKIASDGRRILSYGTVKDCLNDIFLVGSFAYIPIYKRLKELGAKNIYGIRDVYKYSLSELFEESRELSRKGTSNKTLLELYGNIGDVIARIGIVKYFIKRYGEDNIYLLFGSENNADIYRCITENIFVLDEKNIQESDKRLEVLTKIANLQFKISFVLCDTKIYAQRRILNKYNFNVQTVIVSDCLPEQEYLAGLDILNIQDLLKVDKNEHLTAWKKLNDGDLEQVDVNYEPFNKFVAVNLGASKKTRHYNPSKFVDVCDYIANKGYEIVLFGYGEEDEKAVEIITRKSKHKDLLKNFVGKLTISQVAKIMSKADCFVGTESGMWNLSYALGIPSVVIYGGGDYGSFYHPDGLIKYVSVERMDCFYCKWFCDKTNKEGVAKCIDDITPQQIIDNIDILIDEMNKGAQNEKLG